MLRAGFGTGTYGRHVEWFDADFDSDRSAGVKSYKLQGLHVVQMRSMMSDSRDSIPATCNAAHYASEAYLDGVQRSSIARPKATCLKVVKVWVGGAIDDRSCSPSSTTHVHDGFV